MLFVQAVQDFLDDPSESITAEDLATLEHYFNSLPIMTTLFMSVADGMSWEKVVWPLWEVSPLWVLAFLFFVAFTLFAVLNARRLRDDLSPFAPKSCTLSSISMYFLSCNALALLFPKSRLYTVRLDTCQGDHGRLLSLVCMGLGADFAQANRPSKALSKTSSQWCNPSWRTSKSTWRRLKSIETHAD